MDETPFRTTLCPPRETVHQKRKRKGKRMGDRRSKEERERVGEEVEIKKSQREGKSQQRRGRRRKRHLREETKSGELTRGRLQ